MPRIWVTHLLKLGVLLLAGLGVGMLYQRPLTGMLLAAAIALGWHIYWLFQLESWLYGRKLPYLPEGSGIWPRVFARVEFIRGRNKLRGKRFKALLKQMRQATRSFPDGGIILSAEHEILTMNKVAEAMLGLKRKADRGLRIENLIRDPQFIDYLRGDDHSAAVEIPSPLNGGKWLSCHLVPYGLDQKLLLVRDISARIQADQMRRDFVANASHELRTPLTVITGYLEALADDPGLSDDLRQPINEMQRQSDRMRNLVDELLRLSELESEDIAPEATPVNMNAIMKTAGQEARVMKGAPKTVDIELESAAGVLGDEADIQSVLTNLVTNAVRYTGEDGRIIIRWVTDENGGRLSVTDTGKGIASEHLPRLTERFYRVEDGRQRMGGEGGNGLGLAIVKHALQRHSAALEIESELGVGSTFTCVFPPERIATV